MTKKCNHLSQFQNVPFCLPPSAGRQAQILILEILNVWMPVPLYLSGVVNPAMAGSPSLILNPAVSGKHFETASFLKNFPDFFIDRFRWYNAVRLLVDCLKNGISSAMNPFRGLIRRTLASIFLKEIPTALPQNPIQPL